MNDNHEIVKGLAIKALTISGPLCADIERSCWMVVHEYRHGVMPVEYDIREIDETLYLAVLQYVKNSILELDKDSG